MKICGKKAPHFFEWQWSVSPVILMIGHPANTGLAPSLYILSSKACHPNWVEHCFSHSIPVSERSISNICCQLCFCKSGCPFLTYHTYQRWAIRWAMWNFASEDAKLRCPNNYITWTIQTTDNFKRLSPKTLLKIRDACHYLWFDHRQASFRWSCFSLFICETYNGTPLRS